MAEKQKTPQDGQPSLDERINKALASVDDNGKISFDEGADPLFKRAVINEKKARDNQASYTRGQQENAKLKAANEVLNTQLSKGSTLTAEQNEELDELKFTDPDEWFKKRKQYEEEGQANRAGKLEELTTAASEKALKELTLTERTEALEVFQTNTGIVLTDDVMKNDIPPRLQQKIGTMPFEDYLNEVATYLGKGKKVKDTDEVLGQPNLGDLAGSGTTTAAKPKKYQIL